MNITINKRQLEMIAIGKDLYAPITDITIRKRFEYIVVEFLDGDDVKHSERIYNE